MENRSIALLGTGNYAWHLQRLLQNAGVPIHWHYGRNPHAFHDFPATADVQVNRLEALEHANVCFLAISDRSLPAVSKLLAKDGRLLIHVSGGKSIESLKGSRRGVFYLPQTLTKGRDIDLTTLTFCLEADREEDLIWMEELAAKMQMSSLRMNSEARKHLHLAAVFANNFTNHMYAVGTEWLESKGLPPHLLHPLIRETADKAIEMGPTKAQTGPAVRGDIPTIKKHQRMLKDIGLKRLYRQITRHIFERRGKEL